MMDEQHEALTRMHFEMVGEDPADSIVHLRQTCHPKAGATASYNKASGVLSLACCKCGEPLCNVLVAPRPDQGAGPGAGTDPEFIRRILPR